MLCIFQLTDIKQNFYVDWHSFVRIFHLGLLFNIQQDEQFLSHFTLQWVVVMGCARCSWSQIFSFMLYIWTSRVGSVLVRHIRPHTICMIDAPCRATGIYALTQVETGGGQWWGQFHKPDEILYMEHFGYNGENLIPKYAPWNSYARWFEILTHGLNKLPVSTDPNCTDIVWQCSTNNTLAIMIMITTVTMVMMMLITMLMMIIIITIMLEITIKTIIIMMMML